MHERSIPQLFLTAILLVPITVFVTIFAHLIAQSFVPAYKPGQLPLGAFSTLIGLVVAVAASKSLYKQKASS